MGGPVPCEETNGWARFLCDFMELIMVLMGMVVSGIS